MSKEIVSGITSPFSKFEHIYFDDWQLGANYERKVKNGVVSLGKLVKKELCGRSYDPDISLTFESNDGATYQHTMEFDSSYRRVITDV